MTAVATPQTLFGMEELIERLTSKRVIYIGEHHDRYEDHLNQLAVIRGLHSKGHDLAIGMEFFQQPYQAHLDAYVAGEISEKDLLRRTQYFDRWGFDYRLYQAILRFAREQGIPLLALNLKTEIIKRVGEGGIAALTPEEQAQVPVDIDRTDADYRARIKEVFDQHPAAKVKRFEHFLEAQLLWDEGMAECAARYLEAHPRKTLVVLAGSGHLEYGQGIPKRFERRLPVTSAILLNGNGLGLESAVANFLLYPRSVSLPAAGLLGVMLDRADSSEGGVKISGFRTSSGAQVAGVEVGDSIIKIGQEPVASYSDVRIALLGRPPGNQVRVTVRRTGDAGTSEVLAFDVVLQQKGS